MAAKRDGSAIKVNHGSENSSQRARCVAAAFSYVTLQPAAFHVHENQLHVHGRVGRKPLKKDVSAHLSKQDFQDVK